MANDPWGRVDENGAVYVKTPEGERVVGSWQAGGEDDKAEALAFFRRRYDSLATEVQLLEQRLRNTDLAPGQARSSIARLRDTVREANAVGDLESLRQRLDALAEVVDTRQEENRAARARAREEATEVKERIVAEAERVGDEGTHWKAGSERFRQLVDEWKAAGRIDRTTEAELWARLRAARNQFGKRRKAHFAEVEREREEARVRKEELAAEAERLADSTDWGPTAGRYRELMRSWKAAGRAPRDADEALWQRFRAAQDQFFQTRSAAFAERDAQMQEHEQHKEQLLAEAQQLLPVRNAREARRSLRSIQDRWDEIGPAPRASRDRLEGGLRRVAEEVRSAADPQQANPEAKARANETISQLKSSIEQLESRLERARAQGRDKATREAEDALSARKTWLAEAERTLSDLSAGQ